MSVRLKGSQKGELQSQLRILGVECPFNLLFLHLFVVNNFFLLIVLSSLNLIMFLLFFIDVFDGVNYEFINYSIHNMNDD